MKLRMVVGCVLAIGLASCSNTPRQPLNPQKLVTDSPSDMVLPLFMQATLAMAKYYGYETVNYEKVQQKIEAPATGNLPFMPPESVRATPPLLRIDPGAALGFNPDDTNIELFRKKIDEGIGYEGLVRYYITTGWQASKIVCRSYMTQLDEHSQYLDFLQKEFGYANTLANGILLAVGANQALFGAFAIGKTFADTSIDAYQEYRFLNLVDRDAALVLVNAAQDKYAEYFLEQVPPDKPKGISTVKTTETTTTETQNAGGAPAADAKAGQPAAGVAQPSASSGQQNGTGKTTEKKVKTKETVVEKPKLANTFYTFSEALAAVNQIEYQCTREGIRNLITRSVNNTPTNLSIDPGTGAIVFKSNEGPVNDAKTHDEKVKKAKMKKAEKNAEKNVR